MDVDTRTTGPRGVISTTRRMAVERLEGSPASVLLVELFIGLGWLRAAAEKIIDGRWWRGDVLEGFVSDHIDTSLPWYEPFLDVVVLPLAQVVAVVVVVSQLVAGVSLVTGRRLAVGLGVGMCLNLHFMAAGAVTPSAFYLLAQGAVALWLCEQTARRSATRLLRIGGAAAVVAVLNLPFISTLHPAEVIEDPAVMFAFGGSLAALTCLLAAGAATTLPGRQYAPAHARRNG